LVLWDNTTRVLYRVKPAIFLPLSMGKEIHSTQRSRAKEYTLQHFFHNNDMFMTYLTSFKV